MIDKIHCSTKIGNDIHKELVAMFQAIQSGWKFPMHITEEEYNKDKENKTLFLFGFYNSLFSPLALFL